MSLDSLISRMIMMIIFVFMSVHAGSSSSDACKGCFNSCTRGECDEFGCKAGYYGSLCNLPCPTNCAYGGPKTPVCNRTTGHCLSGCATGYHGLTCTETCPTDCTASICTQHEGICVQGCGEHQYGTMCHNKCNESCKSQQCDRNGLCHSCENGYWGLFCENVCNRNCLDDECAMSKDGRPQCSKGCVDHWTGPYCDIENMVDDGLPRYSRFRRETDESCHEHQRNECSCCHTGFRRHEENKQCEPCENCVSKYDRDTKECFESCKPGSYNLKAFCNANCSSNCKSVNSVSSCNSTSGDCFHCRIGYWGERCDTSCSERCVDQTCYKERGKCVDCQDTRYGQFCDLDCDIGCTNNFCDRWNGSCSIGCNAGLYGFYCNNTCSKKCVNSICSLTIYGRLVCTYGCTDGYWGEYCTDNCQVNCTRCNRANGSCVSITYISPGSHHSGRSAYSQKESSWTPRIVGLVVTVSVLSIVLVSIGFWVACKKIRAQRETGSPETIGADTPLQNVEANQ